MNAGSRGGVASIAVRRTILAAAAALLCGWLTMVPRAHAQTTINLSRDLVSLGIATQNMAPNQPALDAGPLFRQAVDWAKTRGVTLITVDTGSYYFLSVDPTSGGTFHTSIRQFNNATIDFAGSDLYFRHNLLAGLSILDSTNLTVTNFSADYIVPPFTQVRVTAVDAASRTISYQSIGVWPSPQTYNDANAAVGTDEEVHVFFFRGTERVQGFGHRGTVPRPIAATAFQIEQAGSAGSLPRIQPGDTALLTLRGGIGGVIRSIRCTGLTISRARIYSAGQIGLFDIAGTQNTFERVYVMPRPGTDRLISSNADGLTLQDPKRGNVIRLSRAIRTGDDGFSPHNFVYGFVALQPSARVLTFPRYAFLPLPNGTHLILQDADTGRVIGEANIVSQEPPYLVTSPANTQTTITVDRDLTNLPTRVALYTDDPSYRGDGTILEKNLVLDMVFARGMTLWGLVNSTARGNYFKRTSHTAIALFHRLRWLGLGGGDFEGPPLINIVLRNNVIDQSNLFYGIAAIAKEAGIVVDSLVAEPGGGLRYMTAASPNSGIRIEDNYIAEPQRSAVRMFNVNGSTVRNNLFIRSNNDPKRDGLWGWAFDTATPGITDHRQPAVVRYSDQVDTEGNQLEPSTVNAVVTDAAGNELVALAPGAAVNLRLATPVALAANATATLTDADGVDWPLTISATSAATIATTLPAGAALGGAYVTVRSNSAVIRGTLFVDTDVSDQSRWAAGRTTLALGFAGSSATGRLADAQGNGIAAAPVKLSLEHLTGPGQLATFIVTGTVPSGVSNGRFQVCVNSCSRSGSADVDVYSAQYEDSGGQAIVNFTGGLTGWSGTFTPILYSDVGGAFAKFTTAGGQSGFLNSRTITVTPGSSFTLTIRARISPASAGSGVIAFLFGTPEVSRATLEFAATTDLGTVTTAADGTFAVALGQLSGAAELVASYAGRAVSWAEQARLPVPYAAGGGVFSTAQQDSQSLLRFYNTGTSAGTATVTLRNHATGQSLGAWTSPSIPAGSGQQYYIGTIEAALGLSTGRPDFYSLSVQSAVTGYFQHVLSHSNGVRSNLSSCSSGVTADPRRLSAVNTSTVSAFGFASRVVVNNTGGTAGTVTLGVYDARNGNRLGTYVTPSIPANAQAILAVATIEQDASVTPTADMFHYVIQVEGSFAGFLQHLITNQRTGIITDMTRQCSLNGNSSSAATAPLRVGTVFSTAQTSAQSLLRFYNTGTSAGTATITLRNHATGQSLGAWTSPSIPAGSAQQYYIGAIEAALGLGTSKPDYYSLSVQSTVAGYFQHVLAHPNGVRSNLSTCSSGVTADPRRLIAVNTSTVSAIGFPSRVIVNNTGSTASTVTLGVYDARNGNRLGAYVTPSIPANAQAILAVANIEAGATVTPTADMVHYIIQAEGSFTGFLQHLITNQRTGTISDMTAVCALSAS